VHASLSQLANLREVFVKKSVHLAVLFGSQATGRARLDSDFDIGILPETDLSLAEELSLGSTLSEIAGSEVDLVRLDRDNPLLAREVAQSAVCIYENAPGVFAAYRARAMSTFIDFEETVAVHREHRLRRLAGRR
jgi:uncharacterized protein